MNKQTISIIGILILVGGLIIVNKDNQSIPTYDWENQSVYNVNREDPMHISCLMNQKNMR